VRFMRWPPPPPAGDAKGPQRVSYDSGGACPPSDGGVAASASQPLGHPAGKVGSRPKADTTMADGPDGALYATETRRQSAARFIGWPLPYGLEGERPLSDSPASLAGMSRRLRRGGLGPRSPMATSYHAPPGEGEGRSGTKFFARRGLVYGVLMRKTLIARTYGAWRIDRSSCEDWRVE
jgi:hypothetical protein